MLVPAERQMWLNAAESPARRRFTLAHEPGHWVCKHLEGPSVPVSCRAAGAGVGEGRLLEREANVFAAGLLMSEDEVPQHYVRTPAETAALLGVSEQAMEWRLFKAGLRGYPERAISTGSTQAGTVA